MRPGFEVIAASPPEGKTMHKMRHLMWGYQGHFHAAAQDVAARTFRAINTNFEPRVLLVGLLADTSESNWPVDLEPPDAGYSREDFSNLKELAIHFSESNPDKRLVQAHEIIEQTQDMRITLSGVQDAIESKCRSLYLRNQIISFSSWPVKVERYFVCIVLQLQQPLYDQYYSLSRDRIRRARFQVRTSLLDALVQEFLAECAKALRLPEPGSTFRVIERDLDELLRAAGKSLMYTAANVGEEFLGLQGLFDSCNIISSLKYEGAEGVGKMIIARRGHPNVEEMITLLNPIHITDCRAVRKLLEICVSELMLITNSVYIYAFGRLVGKYDSAKEDLYIVSFSENYQWELLHDNHSLMKVSYGRPDVPRVKIDKSRFITNLFRIAGKLDHKRTERLWHLIVSASQQRHGTVVVISKNAKEESVRLRHQCIQIDPTTLNADTMKMVTAIDGAVLVDQDSVCYAIGVILDGLATEKGTSSRGARYNSAARYIEHRPGSLAVIISTDGSVDLIPNLPPPIARYRIVQQLEKLREVLQAKESNPRKYNEAMDWLAEHSFYLTKELCEEINDLKTNIETMFSKNEPMMIRTVYDDFVPNAEMNNSFFEEYRSSDFSSPYRR